jgi:hypothetical protein
MSNLTIHYSILDADAEDFVPVFGDDDESSSIPCLDVFFDSGVVDLVHAGVAHDWLSTPIYARFVIRESVDVNRLRSTLRPGGRLFRLFEAVHRAASKDDGLITACEGVYAFLGTLTKK